MASVSLPGEGEENTVRILIDADACPVVDLAVDIAREHRVEVILLCDWTHELSREGVTTLVVSKGADSVDFALVNRVEAGDLVVTQDYGLAAMCLSRRALVIDQNGRAYTDENIDALLARHTARKIRSGGGRLKGPAKRTQQQDAAFAKTLGALLRGQKEKGEENE